MPGTTLLYDNLPSTRTHFSRLVLSPIGEALEANLIDHALQPLTAQLRLRGRVASSELRHQPKKIAREAAPLLGLVFFLSRDLESGNFRPPVLG